MATHAKVKCFFPELHKAIQPIEVTIDNIVRHGVWFPLIDLGWDILTQSGSAQARKAALGKCVQEGCHELDKALIHLSNDYYPSVRYAIDPSEQPAKVSIFVLIEGTNPSPAMLRWQRVKRNFSRVPLFETTFEL